MTRTIRIITPTNSPYELNYYLGMTNLPIAHMKQLLSIVKEDHVRIVKRIENSLYTDKDQNDFVNYILDGSRNALTLNGLVITNCYSLLECQRALLICNLPDLTGRQRKSLYKINSINTVLSDVKITHKNIRCYKTMNEFREVSNAFKHSRTSITTELITKSGAHYSASKMQSLFVNRSKYLESYLKDLYKKLRQVPGLYFPGQR